MAACAKCKFFRHHVSVVELLQSEISADQRNDNNGQIKTMYRGLLQLEEQEHDAEVGLKLNKIRAKEEDWGVKPVHTNYCGKEEGIEQFFISELKNVAADCPDFEEREAMQKNCASCAFSRRTDQEEKDRKEFDNVVRIIRDSTALGLGDRTQELEKFFNEILTNKCWELEVAFRNRRFSKSPPRYLSYCSKFSKEQDFYIPCLIQNPHNTCASWRKAI